MRSDMFCNLSFAGPTNYQSNILILLMYYYNFITFKHIQTTYLATNLYNKSNLSKHILTANFFKKLYMNSFK